MKVESGKKKAKNGGYLYSFLCTLFPLHFLEGPPFLPGKEVTLGSSFCNWREGYRIMKRQDSRLVQKLLVCPLCSTLSTAARTKTETMKPRSTKGREKRLGCVAFGDLE